MSCVPEKNPKVIELASHFPEETPSSVANLLGIWYSKDLKRAEMIPTPEEFRDIIKEIRGSSLPKTDTKTSSLRELRAVDLVFDPQVRRDRVSLISRFFSEKVTKALEEERDRINKKMMEERLSEADRQKLVDDLYSLDRIKILKILTPGGVFESVRKIFEDYLNDTEDGRIQTELNEINATLFRDAIRKYKSLNNPSEEELKSLEDKVKEVKKGNRNLSLPTSFDSIWNSYYNKFSEEKKLAAAKKKASYKTQEYQKIVDHFRPLAEEASNMLIITEGIRVSLDSMTPEKVINKNADTEVSDDPNDPSDIYSKEESYKDGWMTSFREVSSHYSLSQVVRKILRETPALDYKGKYAKDDLGNLRYLDADYVHAALMDKLRYMITSEDMIPLLEDLAKIKPWVKQVIKTIQANDSTFAQFYQDFRKDFVQYWIQKKVYNADGTFTVQTFPINRPEGTYYLIDSWRDNYESGTQLDEDSIYNSNGEINRENATKGKKLVGVLINKFSNLSTQERLTLLESQETWDELIKLFNMIGIDPNPSVLKVALNNIREAPGVEFTDPIMLLLPQLHVIFRGVEKGEVKSETLEDGTVKRGDLINTFGSAYNEIASMLAEVTEDAIESSVRENDKTYYSHVNPSYMGKLIKQLKNVMSRGKEDYAKFIETEFGQYEWFFKDGRWRNDWIRRLVEEPELRKALQHKVVLNHDKIAYQDWDSLDYMLVLFNEFRSEPKEKMAWYHVPILSDSPSAEFIRFVRYTNGSETDADGNPLTFQESIVSRMIDIVNQEYDRIQLVKERGARFLAGENISPIANFDISYNSKGEEKNSGGSVFKFIPQLNSYVTEEGEKFIDKFERLKRESPTKLEQFLKDTLTDIMEEGFEEDYQKWANMGLLDELPNGKFKHLPFQGQSSQNQKVATALMLAKENFGNLFTQEMASLLDKYSKNKPVNDRQANRVFAEIREILNDRVAKGEVSEEIFKNITANLTTKNSSKDALREYYWNSKFATSQIIQLTTTDLAFYKNMEDFQKRYKEVHAPSLRLDTMAKFQGKPIGRTWERTIYLADDEIVSSAARDIEEIFLKKYSDGELSEYDAASVIAKYGLHNTEVKGKKYYKVGKTMIETSYVNVADAQAYRSLSSYRAMMGMMGQWTDEMETAYEHLTDPKGKWTMEDFNIIWQTKKPYVYTQVNNDSGVEGHTGIKTPVQHKNSEFLLLALHDAIAGPLGKSGKLKAINAFMEKHQIDVVQFESTTKVGKQGVIDLNDKAVMAEQELLKKEGKPHTIQDAVASILGKTTGIAQGTENTNVVHKVSYEDYGIQTATPEHGIDAIQLVGTQIRKLITADIADDALITVGNTTKTKKEWLDLYNAINTENILQAFIEVNEIFKDPKKVEEIILEEIRGNTRYSFDMIKACTLNENGVFNIPLYDPIISNMVQQLLNSVIKSRITKQKIRGGALIQVSAYGLTDDLKIVYEGEGEHKRIKYLECYMPAYSRQFYEPLMDKNGNLDVEKLPENLRRLIGYRVPTEDKYSMVPLRIKGFLPQQNGSAIMLPAEITTLSGSDFDIDKLYIMLPEFEVFKRIDWRRLEDRILSNPGFKKWGREKVRMTLEMIQSNMITFEDGSPEEAIFDYYAENKEEFTETVIRRLEYDYSKAPHEQKSYKGDNGLARRNNALIDLMWGILTNEDTASKMLNPGGFDNQKAAARVVTILDSMTAEDLKKEGYTPEDLLHLPLEILDKLASKYKAELDPLSPMTQIILHQQNMTGGKMIGIYANHNANHALMQHTQLGLDDVNGAFTFAGVKRTSLHGVKNEKGEFISRNNANFLAASVDNVKDNTLHATNQNTFTGDASMLLSRLGYNPTEIAILMRQPIVMEITSRVFREAREGKSKDAIIEEVLKTTIRYAGMYDNLTYANVKNNPFDLIPMMEDIMAYKDIASMSKEDRTNFYRRQVAVGLLFQRILKTSEALGDLVQATRADTQGGAAGPTIADTIIKMQKVESLIKNILTNDKYPLVGAGVISNMDLDSENIDSLRDFLLKSPLPFLQAFYTLGLKQTEKMLGRYFPQFSEPFMEVLNGRKDNEGNPIFYGLSEYTKTGKLDVKTINSIFNDLLAYIMSKTSFFGGGINDKGNPVSAFNKRKGFINSFPSYFNEIVENNPDIAELDFIKRLKVVKANDRNPVDILVFKNVGSLSPTLKERFLRDWTSLLYMENPEAHKFALNLFLYGYFRNGFAFGPNTFIHLAPVAIRDAIPGYISTLRTLLESEDSFEEFIEQYIYNHLDNRKLVPDIPDTATTKFTEGEGKDIKVKDEVVISISEHSTYGDKVAVQKEQTIDGYKEYTFHNFIHKKVKGKDYYYRLIDVQDGSIAIYSRIEPLGFKGNFLEYEHGVHVTEMETVIDKNKRDYNPDPDIAAHSTEGLTEDMLESMPNYSEEYSNEYYESMANQIAYERVYNESIQGTIDESDLTSIEPNEDYRDANNNTVCK